MIKLFKRRNKVIGKRVLFKYLDEVKRGYIVANTDEGYIIESKGGWQYVVEQQNIDWQSSSKRGDKRYGGKG